MTDSTPSADPSVVAVEQFEEWFIDRGVPHFIVGYSARTDIWTRAVPLLLVAYVLGGLNALDIRRSLAWNLAAAAAVLAILAAVWAITAKLRRRPLWSLPETVGAPELTVFVVGPVLPSLAVGQWGDAVQSFAEGLGILAAVYLGTSYAVIPLLRWGLRSALGQLSPFFNTVLRVLPLLLLAVTFLFVGAETWQMAGLLHGPFYWSVIAIFVGLGIVFLITRIPRIIDAALAGEGDDDVAELLTDTPVATPMGPTTAIDARLSARERANLMLLAMFGQAVQIAMVVATVFGFFVLFGFLAVPAGTTAAWIGRPPHILLGHDRVISEELLRVAGFLSAFSGMYFTVGLSTDATYREEFADDVTPEIRRVLLVRAAYRPLHEQVRSAPVSAARDR